MKTALILSALLLSTVAFAKPKKHPPPRRPPPATAPAPSPAPTETPPAATPAPAETPAPAPLTPPPAPAPAVEVAPPPTPSAPPPSSAKIDLDALNSEYQSVRDELFRSRAKVELLGTALYKTKLVVYFQYKAQRAWPLKRAQLRLDEQPVWAADAPQADEPIKVYEGFASPGRHVLDVRVDCGAQGETRVGYGGSGNFTIDVPDGKQSRVELTVDETGDGPQHLARKKDGVYYVRVKADVRLLELDQK